ncbi:MAG: hypothetical protein K0R66_1730 [Gammaproteobacteria bacterium]|jgi:hypothetical protein|nr:hypothetical protein [Gammaproteobacteria bacterium]
MNMALEGIINTLRREADKKNISSVLLAYCRKDNGNVEHLEYGNWINEIQPACKVEIMKAKKEGKG